MVLNKQKGSNMYTFIDKTRNFLAGECQHKCKYCYVNSFKNKFPNIKEKYSGEIRLSENELKKDEGKNKTIFVQDMGDLFADNIPKEFIIKVLEHLREYPENNYLFQTKNPKRFIEFKEHFPTNSILGTTLETNYEHEIEKLSNAPSISNRVYWISRVKFTEVFITLEPILNFHLQDFVAIIEGIQPNFINIGADSKQHKLNEPDGNKIRQFIDALKQFTEVRIKNNLNRLLNEDKNNTFPLPKGRGIQ